MIDMSVHHLRLPRVSPPPAALPVAGASGRMGRMLIEAIRCQRRLS